MNSSFQQVMVMSWQNDISGALGPQLEGQGGLHGGGDTWPWP